MRAKKKIFLTLFGVVLLLALATGVYVLHTLILVGAAYQAKMLCSGVFVAGRDAEAVVREDIAANQHPVLHLIRARVDHEHLSTSAGLFGLRQREAVYRNGLG